MAKDPMFQRLCSTSTWKASRIMPNSSNSYLFMFLRASCSTQRFHNSCAPKPLAQQKNQILMCSRASRSTQTSNTHVLQSFSLNTNIKYPCAPDLLAQHKTSHQLCDLGSTPNTWNHIYITFAIGLRPIYQTNHHVHVQWGIRPNIPNKTSK